MSNQRHRLFGGSIGIWNRKSAQLQECERLMQQGPKAVMNYVASLPEAEQTALLDEMANYMIDKAMLTMIQTIRPHDGTRPLV